MNNDIVKEKKVNIIIVNYNSWKDLIECLKSIDKSRYTNYQIFIVDNNSQDNSIEEINSWFKENRIPALDISLQDFENTDFLPKIDAQDLVLIRNNKNEGFASGNNVAIKYLINNREDEYVWLLNPDTEVEENVLAQLIAE